MWTPLWKSKLWDRLPQVIPIPKTHSLRGLARSGESWLIQCCSRFLKKQQMALGFGFPDFGKKLPKFDGSSLIHSSCSPQRQESFGICRICAPSSFFHESDCCRVPIDRFRNLKRRNSGSFHDRNLAWNRPPQRGIFLWLDPKIIPSWSRILLFNQKNGWFPTFKKKRFQTYSTDDQFYIYIYTHTIIYIYIL